MILQRNEKKGMIGETICLTIPKLKYMEEGLVSPHRLVTIRDVEAVDCFQFGGWDSY